MTHSLPTDAEIAAGSAKVRALLEAMNEVLYGQEDLIEAVVTGLLARGHLLLEGLPGLGKTELVKGLSGAIGLQTKRVQFTPDLLPGDITGNPVLQEVDGRRSFVFQPGPLFASLVLAPPPQALTAMAVIASATKTLDFMELTRSPPSVRSADTPSRSNPDDALFSHLAESRPNVAKRSLPLHWGRLPCAIG